MLIEGEDGVTHINIYSKSKTNLGKWLSNFTYSPITTKHGDFASIEGYWFYLLTGDDRLKILHGFKAKKLGGELLHMGSTDDWVFKKAICEAIDLKLKSNFEKFHQFAASTLPFCHYYEYSGKRVDAGYEWIVDHFEDRRALLKEHFKNRL